MFVQISNRGKKREREDKSQGNKEDNDDTNSTEMEGTETEGESAGEGFSTVELSSGREMDESQASSRSGQFLGKLKKSSVGKLFKSDARDQDISIYTIDSGGGGAARERAVDVESRLEAGELGSRLRQTAAAPRPSESVNQGRTRSTGSQATPYPPYRLYFLPPPDWQDADSTLQSLAKLISCQCSVACFLLVWLLLAAVVFYLTEGANEDQLAEVLNSIENSTMISMATDLRLLDPEYDPWDDVLIKYFGKHREEIFSMIGRGYMDDTQLWTFPGSILCAISILTTLGLGSHLPQTTSGIVGGAIFASIGIPIHMIFILNLGRTIAIKVQLFAKEAENKASDLRQRIINVRRFGEDRKRETWPEQMFFDFKPPSWLAYFPLLSVVIYYVIGLLIFGLARSLPSTWEIFTFFTDFSRGRHSNGFSRMGYAWYLEGAAILAGVNLALLRDSPFPGLTELLRPHGLVTNSLD